MPPGVEQWGFIEAFNAFLAGNIAMTVSWPPVGRWAAGYGKGTEALSWIPETKVVDKVGYAFLALDRLPAHGPSDLCRFSHFSPLRGVGMGGYVPRIDPSLHRI